MIPGWIGHETAVELFKRRAAGLQHGHAFLIHGEQHLGKETLATAFMMSMNCETRTACGQCSSCDKIRRHAFPYILRLESRWGEIPVDALRERVRALGLRPPAGVTQFLLVDDAGNLNASGANMLLKTLEEPPPDTLLLLITARIERILPTIRSRCQEVSLHRVPRAELLQTVNEIEPEVQKRLLDAADGRPGILLRLLEGDHSIPRGDLYELAESCWNSEDASELVKVTPMGPDLSELEEVRLQRILLRDEIAARYLAIIHEGDLWDLLAAAACLQSAISHEHDHVSEAWETVSKAGTDRIDKDLLKQFDVEAKDRLKELREREIHGILHSLIRQLKIRASMVADNSVFRQTADGIARIASLYMAHRGVHLRSDRLIEEAGLELRRLRLHES